MVRADERAAMTPARFQALVEAYGAEPRRWPEGERPAAERFAETHSEIAAPLLAAAAALDRCLAEALAEDPAPVLSAAAAERMRARARPGLLAGLRQAIAGRGPLWQPAGALAAALVLGLGLGVGAPGTVPLSLAPDGTAAATTAGTDQAAAALQSDISLFLYGPAAPDPLAAGTVTPGATTETGQ